MKRSSKKKVVVFFVVILTLFRGLRWEVGTDWDSYLFIFNNTTWSNFLNAPKGATSNIPIEAGYAFLNALVHTFGNYTLFLLVTNLFICVSYAYFSFKYTTIPIITFVLFNFGPPFFPIRQTLASVVLLYAFPYIIEKKFFKFVLIGIIAFLIHRSTIFYLPFYFVLSTNIPFALRMGIFVGSLLFLTPNVLLNIILFFAEKLLNVSPFFAAMVAGNTVERSRIGNTNLSISILVSILFIIVFEIYKFQTVDGKKIVGKKQNRIVNVCINSYLISTLISKLFSGKLMGEYSRLAGVFIVGFPLIAALSFGYYRKKYSAIIYIVLVLFFIYRYSVMRGLYPELHFPYKSILN
jgi:hypothetical protein